MQSKSLLIAIAAFALTATGAQAYVGTKYINQAGLSPSQIDAFTQARELRRKGEVDKARDLLVKAGLNEDSLASLRVAAKEAHEAIHEAVENDDFAAFRKAIEGTPLFDIVTTEADFVLFKEAHELREKGDFAEAKEIMDELGVENFGKSRHSSFGGRHDHEKFASLTDEQREALRVARQANDDKTASEILKEAGFERPENGHRMEKRNWYKSE